MATVVDDLIEGCTIVEENGEVVEAVYPVLVKNVTHLTPTVGRILYSAMLTSGVPQPGDSLATFFPNCRVERRTAEIVQLTAANVATVKVTSYYKLQRATIEPVSGGTSLTQIRTQVDRLGNPIEVTYQGTTVRAEIDVMASQSHFVREVMETTADPDGIADTWKNSVNDATWKSKPPNCWMITNVDYELVWRASMPANDVYRFSYQFEGRDDPGWIYTVAYKDANGDIPEDVVDGTGIVDVEWHTQKDFAAKFGA